MFFHLGFPTFVSVINAEHLVDHSRPCLHVDFDIKMRLNSSERGCLASHWAACVGMINVTNHLLTRGGQSFGLLPITLLVPAVFSLPLFPVDAFISPGNFLPNLSCPPADIRQHNYVLICSKGYDFLFAATFIFWDFSPMWPQESYYVVASVSHLSPCSQL